MDRKLPFIHVNQTDRHTETPIDTHNKA